MLRKKKITKVYFDRGAYKYHGRIKMFADSLRKNNMKKINNTKKRSLRNRKKLKSVSVNRYRISVFKSLKNISAQIIDDKEKKTLVSVSSIEKEIKANKKKKNRNICFIRRDFSKTCCGKKNNQSLF